MKLHPKLKTVLFSVGIAVIIFGLFYGYTYYRSICTTS